MTSPDSIAAGNARSSEFFRALTDRGIDPFAPSGPDPGDRDYVEPDEEETCADCRYLGHVCRSCMDEDIAERRAEARADRAADDDREGDFS